MFDSCAVSLVGNCGLVVCSVRTSLLERFVEIEGRLRRILSVIKLRASPHSSELREYAIDEADLSALRWS